MSYPKLNDDNFGRKISEKYKKYKIEPIKKSIKKSCSKHKLLTKPQKFLAKFIGPNTPYNGILIFHRIGSGKTCASIRIGEAWKNSRKIIVVTPASLKNSFRDELRSSCGKYLTNREMKELGDLTSNSKRYKEIIERSDKKIDKYYHIYSYNKFLEGLKRRNISFRKSVIIIDEIQNLISETGKSYKILYETFKQSPDDLKIVLLSATPMFDRPNEIALIMNLFKIPVEFPTGTHFNKMFIKSVNGKFAVKNKSIFQKMINGFISYYRGPPSYVYPELHIKYVNCQMSNFQYNVYKKVVDNENKTMKKKITDIIDIDFIDLPNSFYIGSRIASNIVLPNKKINETGIVTFTKNKILEHLEMYSTKYEKIIKKIGHAKGKIFIYSSFKRYGGIQSFSIVLKSFGYKNYFDYGTGKKRYVIWSGDESTKKKNEILSIFNNKNNLNGNLIKILLGTPSIKEGISLLAVRQVHIIEPYWNKSRIDQIIGRASRFCSHISLPHDEWIVRIYIYIATSPKGEETVDQFMVKLAINKDKLIKTFEKLIKEVAIDCRLNLNANNDIEKINCK